MMRYLDNAESDKDAVNENYGRELLELHTVGIDGGLHREGRAQQRVHHDRRTVDAEQGRARGNFIYDPGRHWTGAVKVLGFTHANTKAGEGLAVGDAYLTLPRHATRRPPSTSPASSPCGSSATTRPTRWSTGSPRRTWTAARRSCRCSRCCSARSSSGSRPG